MLLSKKIVISVIAFLILVIFVFILVIMPLCTKIRNEHSHSLLINAVQDNNIEECRILLDKGLSPNVIDGIAIVDIVGEATHLKFTPLQLAAYNGNTDMVRLLISYGADVNYTPKNTLYSALHRACQSDSPNRSDIIRLLIENGADVNLECNYFSAIEMIIRNNTVLGDEKENIDLLVKAGAKIITDVYDDYLFVACGWAWDKHLIEYFVSTGKYNINGGKYISQYCRNYNNEGYTSYSEEIFDLLISCGADIYEKDKDGKCALEYIHGNNAEYWEQYLIDRYAKQSAISVS